MNKLFNNVTTQNQSYDWIRAIILTVIDTIDDISINNDSNNLLNGFLTFHFCSYAKDFNALAFTCL